MARWLLVAFVLLTACGTGGKQDIKGTLTRYERVTTHGWTCEVLHGFRTMAIINCEREGLTP